MSDQKKVQVIDLSCTAENDHRKHEVIVNGDIVSVDFYHGQPTILSYEIGMKFVKPGFKVLENGVEYELPAEKPVGGALQLQPDEVVAKYTELTLSALQIRAAGRVGGEVFLSSNDESEIISFLKGEKGASFAADFVDDEENLLDDEDDEDSVESQEAARAAIEASRASEPSDPAALEEKPFDVNGIDTPTEPALPEGGEKTPMTDADKAAIPDLPTVEEQIEAEKVEQYNSLVAGGMSDYEARETVWPGSEDSKNAPTEEGKA